MSKVKFLFIVISIVSYAVFAQQYWRDPFKPAKKASPNENNNISEGNLSNFKDDDMVLLAKDGAEFIIGEGVQAVTAKRSLNSYYINKYETTYSLWYEIRIRAESIGYVFLNPGQEGTAGRRGKEPVNDELRFPVTIGMPTDTDFPAKLNGNMLPERKSMECKSETEPAAILEVKKMLNALHGYIPIRIL